MTLSEWASVAEIVGVSGILASLISLNVQFRQSKKRDEREAAFELIRSFQTVEFTKIMLSTFDVPAGLSRQELDERFGGDMPALLAYFATWESLGIMVHRRQIELELVCDFFSHPILDSWNMAESYVTELRDDLGRDTPWEWFQWLAEKVAVHESQKPPSPAFVEHKNWT